MFILLLPHHVHLYFHRKDIHYTSSKGFQLVYLILVVGYQVVSGSQPLVHILQHRPPSFISSERVMWYGT